jgi:hypothetical protein
MIIRLTLPDTPNYTTPRGTIKQQAMKMSTRGIDWDLPRP